MTEPTESAAFRQAAELLSQGDSLAAEKVVADAAAAAASRHGEHSPEHAAAQFDLAKILCAVGDLQRAAAAVRDACAVEGTDDRTTKDRLTYNMNLGEILQRLGDLEQAEEVLREGLVDRAALYGEEHPGYAFGIEPLADVLRQKGELEEAIELINEAVTVLWRNGHPQVAAALAKRASVAKALGAPSFEQFDQLPEELFDEMIQQVLHRAEVEEPGTYLGVLNDLREAIVARRGAEDPWLVNVAAAIADTARAAQDHGARQEALRWIVEAQTAHGDTRQVVDALMALGLAQDEAGQHDDAEASYRRAADKAVELGDPVAHAAVLRNFGLYLAQRDRHPEAGELLGGSVEKARASGDPEALGQALVAFGIFRQHDGQLAEARAMLEEALGLLDPAHPDTLYARSHLGAIEGGGGCGCGDMSSAVGEALKTMILEQCPPGLVERLEVSLPDGAEPRFDVSLAREPAPNETELLERIIHQATAELRRRIRERGRTA